MSRPREAGQRAPWGSISRVQVVDAATKALQNGGYEAMTIRSLAADLGVAPMSLYRHVRDKDDLLDEVVDRLFASVWRPRARKATWREYVAEAAERLRAFLVAQPAALYVYLRHPVVSPTAIERMEAVLQVLREAGFEDREAQRMYATIHTYTIGFAALEASRAAGVPDKRESTALAAHLAAFTSPRQFHEGLGYLLDAIERRAADTAARGRVRKAAASGSSRRSSASSGAGGASSGGRGRGAAKRAGGAGASAQAAKKADGTAKAARSTTTAGAAAANRRTSAAAKAGAGTARRRG